MPKRRNEEADEPSPSKRVRSNVPLECTSVDLHLQDNRNLHHTDRYEQQDLIVRRGQKFQLSLKFKRELSCYSVIALQFALGPEAHERNKTLIRIPVSIKPRYKTSRQDWKLVIDSIEKDAITCSVTPPSNANIGRYKMHVESQKDDADTFSRSGDNDIIVIFNPWNKFDDVFIKTEADREEYVMNEMGIIWDGCYQQMNSTPWNFGQFEEPCLDALFHLLDKGNLKYNFRYSAVSIIRKISALTNRMNDEGVLHGKWEGNFEANCTKPCEWTGSVQILKQYMKKKTPVKYGQCWVFSGLVTTLLRAVGIPTRSVTNYESAHDTDLSMTIDFYFNEKGEPIKKIGESVWNFHVWNESWLKRPDLPKGYDGWQAHDATPQEPSIVYNDKEQKEKVICCGPAPVRAIKEGHVYLKYDVGFMYAEVNGDVIHWTKKNDGKREVDQILYKTIGKKISTKSVGSNRRQDLTSKYKYRNGCKSERRVAKLVNRYSSIKDENIYKQKTKEIDFEIVSPKETLIGDDMDMNVDIKNNMRSTRKFKVTMTLVSCSYMGIHGKRIFCRTEEHKLKAGEKKKVTVTVNGEGYKDQKNSDGRFNFIFHARSLKTNRVYANTQTFCLRKPCFSLKKPEPLHRGRKTSYTVSFKNTTRITLNNVFFKMDTDGKLSDGVIIKKFKNPVRPNDKVTQEFELQPCSRCRHRVSVTVTFNSDEITGIKQQRYFEVHV